MSSRKLQFGLQRIQSGNVGQHIGANILRAASKYGKT
eukprot:CAMPEP_0114036934 /NCGR_PEP_ID=MMETSP1339-20121228/1239_1 /TAXON_ID=94617 /ORGANISM="Fibrocapsa japonica" /LENGTH=36 /assembly_acc=CAM_ASM_000762